MPKRTKKQNTCIADHTKYNYQTVFKNKKCFRRICIRICIYWVLFKRPYYIRNVKVSFNPHYANFYNTEGKFRVMLSKWKVYTWDIT